MGDESAVSDFHCLMKSNLVLRKEGSQPGSSDHRVGAPGSTNKIRNSGGGCERDLHL